MATILFRTLIIYLLLVFAMKLMGKRQIGELEISELVSTLLISEIAAIPIDDPDIPLLNAILPIIFILCAEILLSTLKNKSDVLKSAVEGKPVFLIFRGRLLQKNLAANRLSINELLTELHTQGIGALSDVQYAILEPSGRIAVLKKSLCACLAHPLIIDGSVCTEILPQIGLTESWLDDYLTKKQIDRSDVFLLTRDDCGKISLIRKENL